MVDYATLEVAPTARSRCRACKKPIAAQGVRLRLGWERGAAYYHPMCAVAEHWHRLLAAAALPGALPLEADVVAAIERARQAVQARVAVELAAAGPGRPTVERPESSEQCLHCGGDIEAGTLAILDERGWLHPACVPPWLDTDVVDGARWHRALGEFSDPEELDELAEVLERY